MNESPSLLLPYFLHHLIYFLKSLHLTGHFSSLEFSDTTHSCFFSSIALAMCPVSFVGFITATWLQNVGIYLGSSLSPFSLHTLNSLSRPIPFHGNQVPSDSKCSHSFSEQAELFLTGKSKWRAKYQYLNISKTLQHLNQN